jgi:hypothetical protein
MFGLGAANNCCNVELRIYIYVAWIKWKYLVVEDGVFYGLPY